MILGIGIDMVSHEETKLLDWQTNTEQLCVFSKEELIVYHENNALSFLAGRFAAKEAVLKCLGIGMEDGISLEEINVLRNDSEKPYIELMGKVKTISDSMGIISWHVSISHSTENSIAIAVAEGL